MFCAIVGCTHRPACRKVPLTDRWICNRHDCELVVVHHGGDIRVYWGPEARRPASCC